MQNSKIYINEIFPAIQGEGLTSGTPSLFIRLQGCDLGCAWCDTKFTWHKDYLEKADSYSVTELIEIIRSYKQLKNLVITGGEPMLQQLKFKELLECLKDDYTFEIETNGMHLPCFDVSQIKSFNISPKISSSGNKIDLRYDSKKFKYFAYQDNVIFKFVVARTDDIKEIKRDFYFVPKEKIWLMPEGTDQKSQLNHLAYKVYEECIRNGYNFSPRIQCIYFNDTRRK